MALAPLLRAAVAASAFVFVPSAVAAPAVTAVASFPGVDQRGGGGATPPDPQIAAGPTSILTAVNNLVQVRAKDGTVLKSATPNAFLHQPRRDDMSDPQLAYDVNVQRFFATFMNVSRSAVVVAVSANADPLSKWTVARFDYSDGCPDQPHLGISDKVVALSALLFPGGSCEDSEGGGPPESDTIILNKAQLMGGDTTPAFKSFTTRGKYAGDTPALAVGAAPRLMVADIDTSRPTTKILIDQFTGAPPKGRFRDDFFVTIPKTASPPKSANVEPEGRHLDLDDDRFRSAYQVGNLVYLASQVACRPAGDTASRSCARVFAIDVKTHALAGVATYGIPGASVAYPAIAPDSAGNAWMIAGDFNPSVGPSLFATAFGPDLTVATDMFPIMDGDSPQTGAQPGLGVRYGDYFGASVDPADPTKVWVTGQYAQARHWNTQIAQLTLDPAGTPIGG